MSETIYLVAASGGLEEPSFQSFTDKQAALVRYREFARDLLEPDYGDRVDLLEISGDRINVLAATPDD